MYTKNFSFAHKAKGGGDSWLGRNSPVLWSDHDKGLINPVKELFMWLFFWCALSSTASASEAASESDSSIWNLIQECEKQTMEEDEKPEFAQCPDTSSPDLVEFER